MDLVLVRHGIAEERGPGVDDFGRRLTPAGRARMEEAARGLGRLVTPQVVFSSPLTRAMETAEILRERFGLGRVRTCAALASPEYASVLEAVAEADAEVAALVGHEPWMGELLSYLLTGDPGLAAVTFKKGGAALVRSAGEPEPGSCWLEWLVPPGVLRRLGAAKAD
ncbi:SixA phosphatase family protein [Tepidiforma sp.]|uniref:SixA phosphatase family protein n=1 Tax=Tepidiforma sp. TaxID=2682230 RepID=UPI002ADE4616|nr:histidine phosphatase family protein [Tepidiforma sp.]